MLYGDIERYKPDEFKMNWGKKPDEIELEDDDIDFD